VAKEMWTIEARSLALLEYFSSTSVNSGSVVHHKVKSDFHPLSPMNANNLSELLLWQSFLL